MDPTNTMLTSLAANGPWAAMSGILLYVVIKAWTCDREQVTRLLSEFKGTLDSLSAAVNGLSQRLDHYEQRDKR